MRAPWWAAALLLTAPAVAQPVLVRLGNHEHFGRVVFEFPKPQPFALERSGNAVVLQFPGGGDVPDGAGAARNIAAVTGGGGMATLTVSTAAHVKALTIGNRVVVDVSDHAAAKPGSSSQAVGQATNGQAGPSSFHDRDGPPAMPAPGALPQAVPLSPITGPVEAVMPIVVPHASEVIPSPPTAPPSTLALAALRRTPGHGTALVIPFDTSVGVAAFPHGQEAWLVFDDRRPIDWHEIGNDADFQDATVELLPSATLIKIRLHGHRRLHLERKAEGWSVQADDAGDNGQAVMPTISPSRLLFPVTGPSQVVVVPDPATGRNLLVGSLRAFGPGVPTTIRAPEFTVVPSWQGLVVEPVSDRTSMRPVLQGFTVETGSTLSPSLENGQSPASAAALTRRFDISGDPVATLLRRLQTQTQDEGQAPSQSRLELRKATVQTMLALGLGVEAQSLLRLAITDDPRAVADLDLNGLAGIAAIVSGRLSEAGGLDAAGLSGTDDVALWRAVRAAMVDEKSPEAAQAFAATVGLVLGYPSALRNRLLPIAAETMVNGGASKAADALLAQLSEEPLLAMARAMRLEQKGETAPALTLYDALADGRDRLASARAATRAILLRLATGAVTPGEAGDALERHLNSWRGDAREQALRLQLAAILADAGRWRDAFRALKETAQLYPDNAQSINARAAELFDRMLRGPGAANAKPLDLVTLVEENADLVAKSGLADLAPLLADKLVALDLPDRAGPLIERMIAGTPVGATRAGLGSRLAAMQLASGDAVAAAAALGKTDQPDLPPALAEERGLLEARIAASRHDIAGAIAILARVGTAGADELSAAILGENGDWQAAALALNRVVVRTLPDRGALTAEQQDLVLRLASAQSRAGDDAALSKLGKENALRISGARADIFRLLTSAPVTAADDLRRSGQELATLREIPTAMAAIGRR